MSRMAPSLLILTWKESAGMLASAEIRRVVVDHASLQQGYRRATLPYH